MSLAYGKRATDATSQRCLATKGGRYTSGS